MPDSQLRNHGIESISLTGAAIGGGKLESSADAGNDIVEFPVHLVPGGSGNPVARGHQDPIASTVALECHRRPVTLFAVGFDHDTEFLP